MGGQDMTKQLLKLWESRIIQATKTISPYELETHYGLQGCRLSWAVDRNCSLKAIHLTARGHCLSRFDPPTIVDEVLSWSDIGELSRMHHDAPDEAILTRLYRMVQRLAEALGYTKAEL